MTAVLNDEGVLEFTDVFDDLESSTTVLPSPITVILSADEVVAYADSMVQQKNRAGDVLVGGDLYKSIITRGWVQGDGPMPCVQSTFNEAQLKEAHADKKEGRGKIIASLLRYLDRGNQRFKNLGKAIKEFPDKFKSTKVTVNVYPKFTEAQELAFHRLEAATTLIFDQVDYIMDTVKWWTVNGTGTKSAQPGGKYQACVIQTGLNRFCRAFRATPAGDDFIFQGRDCVGVKPGGNIFSPKGKGAKGIRKDIAAQFGWYLAQQPPFVLDMVKSRDPVHGFDVRDYKLIVELHTLWNGVFEKDPSTGILGLKVLGLKKLKPELDAPVPAFSQFLKVAPDHDFVRKIADRINNGRQKQKGRQTGDAARMSLKDVQGEMQSTRKNDPSFLLAADRINGTITGADNLLDLDVYYGADTLLQSLTPPSAEELVTCTPESCKVFISAVIQAQERCRKAKLSIRERARLENAANAEKAAAKLKTQQPGS